MLNSLKRKIRLSTEITKKIFSLRLLENTHKQYQKNLECY